eukprot:scpid60308/ scgid0874/ 
MICSMEWSRHQPWLAERQCLQQTHRTLAAPPHHRQPTAVMQRGSKSTPVVHISLESKPPEPRGPSETMPKALHHAAAGEVHRVAAEEPVAGAGISVLTANPQGPVVSHLFRRPGMENIMGQHHRLTIIHSPGTVGTINELIMRRRPGGTKKSEDEDSGMMNNCGAVVCITLNPGLMREALIATSMNVRRTMHGNQYAL